MRQARRVCARGHLLPPLARSACSRTAVPPQNNKSSKDTKYSMQPTTLMQHFLAYLIHHSLEKGVFCVICLPLFVSRHSIYYFGTETIDKDQNICLFLNKCIVCLRFSLARWPLTSHSLRRAPSTVGDSLLPLSPNLLPRYLPTFKISPNLLHVYSLKMD